MLHNWNNIEQHIHWKLNFGDCFFRWDNLLGEGHLAQFTNNSNGFNNRKVADFLVDVQKKL